MSYLAQYADPALDTESITADSVQAEEMERLARLLAVAQLAYMIPRRLGTEATDEELAADKKTARRVWHAAEQSLVSWNNNEHAGPAPVSDELQREAAQIEWRKWYYDHHAWLEQRRRMVATWAILRGGDPAFAKRALVRYENEIRWLEYALRDLPAAA